MNSKPVQIESSWKEKLRDSFQSESFIRLKKFLKSEKATQIIYPAGNKIFSAFNLCPFDNVKIVIIGQDPYHGPKQANGLCFSVSDGIKPPPSLQNIFKELKDDLDLEIPSSGNLEHWAKQGVLMLNATLTVRARQAGSHQKKGWEEFTDNVIRILSEEKENLIFLLWGHFAQNKAQIINNEKHYILTAAHPSPFSAHSGFFGCKHFSMTNEILIRLNQKPIKWGK
ncbi:MAG: uracil-DNA glycosylase [Flavobacteriales bacterium]|nr:uracil-DNA glycosylase [Flavobacteriales bacterium]